jgi:hypothetical protein
MLLDDIIELLGSEQSSLTEALLKTKILLHQIGKKELVEWVNLELNGYPADIDVPPYRNLSAHVRANISNPRGRYRSHPIPIGHLEVDQQESLQRWPMKDSLAALAELAKAGTVGRDLPMELNHILGKQLGNHFLVEKAWCEIGTHEITGIFVHVRSRLLDFLLELKDSTGASTTEADLKEKTKSVDANSMFNNAIFGPNTTILVGHQSTINATQNVNGAELAANVRELVAKLETILPTSGLPVAVQSDSREVLAELREAISVEKPDVGRLRRGLESLKHVMEHAAGHLVAAGALAAIAQLLGTAAH